MKILFINPHPDDTEFACASTCQQAVDLGWDVYEILMTTDEYGTDQDDFKGKRIRRIRKREMETLFKIGCSRGTVFALQSVELVLVAAAGLLLALGLAVTQRRQSHRRSDGPVVLIR